MAVKDSVLQALIDCKGSFISGEELSNKMGVTRTSVWKAINTLREEGHPIEAVTNKGYMLMEDNWTITEKSLKACLPSRYKSCALHIFDTIESTNTYAKQIALDNAQHGTIVISHQQTGGRGRLGRSFFSPKEGIYLSIILKPDFDLKKSVLMTSAAAVAVAESIESVCDLPAKIKWVNDIFVSGKKVCGILTEGLSDFETGKIDTIIVGIGLNTSLNGFPKELLDIAGAIEGNYSKSALTAAIICRILDTMENLDKREFMKAYKEKSLVMGKEVKVYNGSYKLSPEDTVPSRTARVLNIDNDGGLVVLYSDGTRETLSSGEISIRL